MRNSGTWLSALAAGMLFLAAAQCAAALDVNGTYSAPVIGETTINNGIVYQYVDNMDPDPDEWMYVNDTTDVSDITIVDGGAATGSSSMAATADNSLHLAGGDVESITMQGTASNTLNMNNAGSAITGTITINSGATDINISDGTVSGAINVNGDGTGTIDISGGTVSGSITTAAGDTVWNITGDTLLNGSTLTLNGGGNRLNLGLGSQTGNAAKVDVVNTIQINNGGNTLSVGANTLISDNTTVTIDASGNNTYIFRDWSEFSADWTNVQGDGNRLEITEATDFNGSINFTGGGNSAYVGLGRGSDLTPAPVMTGQIVFADTAAGTTTANSVQIAGGTLHNVNGSVIASNVVDTAFTVSGGETTLLVSGVTGTTSTYAITGGDVADIRQQDGSVDFVGGEWVTDYVAKNDLTGSHNVTYGGGSGINFQSYSILNVDRLTTQQSAGGARTITSIGGFTSNVTMPSTIANQTQHWTPDMYGNQVTADSLLVNGNSKLIIHEDETRLGSTNLGNPVDHTVINSSDVYGELTVDRGSIHSVNTDGTAKINVMGGGILYGFGENSYDPAVGPYTTHTAQYEQQRANLYGDLTLDTGSTLQPYDLGLANSYYTGGLKVEDDGLFDGWDYNTFDDEHRGSVFRVDADTNGGNGRTIFNNGSWMRSRLFHGLDGRRVSLLGERDNALPNAPDPADVLDTQYSDSLLSLDVDFSDVLNDVTTTTGWTAQYNKVQYDPVFGFQYDLKSKQEFEIYLDNDLARLHQDKTYYFAVVNSETAIEELGGYNDANHLFNKLILKSDMLGKYDFLKSGDNQSIYLRYRQLAYHPTEGGIKRTMSEGLNRNEIVPGQYLDEIRYPFRGQPGSDLNDKLSVDHSEDVVGDGYNNAGYNGEMWGDGDGFYAETSNPVFDNIRKEWIQDWENLFQGMQLDVADNADMHRAVQMLHAETYANISQTAFDVLNQFTRNRERNAVSALFQVEKEFREEAMARIDGEAGSGEAYASLAEFDPRDFYVRNPIRFWASAFGAHGDQSANSGGHNEMAYDNIVWGGSVGAVKELGDYYLGATLGYADATAKYHSANVNSKSYIAEGLVGARIFCLGFAEAYASYSYNDHKNVRVVDLASNQLGGYHGVATGDFASHVFSGGARIGYQKTLGENWLLIPTLGVNVMHHRGANFTESGRWTMANRMVFDKDSMNRTTVRIPVEVRLSRAVALGDVMLMPEVRAGITPFLGDKQGEATAKWVGNPINDRYFTSYGADRGSFEGWVGATVELSKRGRFYAAANYDYIYGSKYGAHNYSIQAGINF